jgi:hypothetical protein
MISRCETTYKQDCTPSTQSQKQQHISRQEAFNNKQQQLPLEHSTATTTASTGSSNSSNIFGGKTFRQQLVSEANIESAYTRNTSSGGLFFNF